MVSLRNINFTIYSDHPCLAGHFPDNPIVPAVTLLDELISAIFYQQSPPENMVIKQAKFIGPVFPGERVNVHLQRTKPDNLLFNAYKDSIMVFNGEFFFPPRS